MKTRSKTMAGRLGENPLAVAVCFAALAILAHAGAEVWTSHQAASLQRETTQAQRILQAVNVENPDRAAANLRFLVDAGLIADAAGPVEAYLQARAPGAVSGLRRFHASSDDVALPRVEDYDFNRNGRIDGGREAEIFLLHANAPEIRFLDEDMNGELGLPEMTRYLEYMSDINGPDGPGLGAAQDRDSAAPDPDQSASGDLPS